MCTLRGEETTFHSSFVPMCQANTNLCLLSSPERIKGTVVLEEDPVGKLLTLQILRTSIRISKTWEKAKCSTWGTKTGGPLGLTVYAVKPK